MRRAPTVRGLALALAAAALLLLGAGEAWAVYSCGGQKDDCKCGKNNPYPCCSNGGNCTWWAWEAACCNWKVALPGWGNAKQWAGNAKAHGSYDLRQTPVAGSIGVRVTGYYGHVVWVKSVSGSSVTVTEMNCCSGCNYGMRTKTYSASYFDGGFIVRKNSCACSKGATQSQSCGNCGKQKRTCGSDCQWGSWSSCSGGGACASGKVESQPCGSCGGKKRTCSSSCSWGSWSSCNNQGACASGKVETQTCGNCGTQKRTCSTKCAWGSWGSCGQGECTPGKVQSQSCAAGGTKRRTCNKGCTWGAWSSCATDGGATPPDRGGSAGDVAMHEVGASFDLPPVGQPGAGNMEGSCDTGRGSGGAGLLATLSLLLLCLVRRRRARTEKG